MEETIELLTSSFSGNNQARNPTLSVRHRNLAPQTLNDFISCIRRYFMIISQVCFNYFWNIVIILFLSIFFLFLLFIFLLVVLMLKLIPKFYECKTVFDVMWNATRPAVFVAFLDFLLSRGFTWQTIRNNAQIVHRVNWLLHNDQLFIERDFQQKPEHKFVLIFYFTCIS